MCNTDHIVNEVTNHWRRAARLFKQCIVFAVANMYQCPTPDCPMVVSIDNDRAAQWTCQMYKQLFYRRTPHVIDFLF